MTDCPEPTMAAKSLSAAMLKSYDDTVLGKQINMLEDKARNHADNQHVPWYLWVFKKQVKRLMVASFQCGYLSAPRNLNDTIKIKRPTVYPTVNAESEGKND